MSEKINEKRGIEKSSKPVPPKAVYCPAYSLSQATCAAIRPPAPPPPFPSPLPPFAIISPCPEKSTVLIRILPPLPPPLLDVPLAPSLSMMPSKCREYPTVIWEKENQTARVKVFFWLHSYAISPAMKSKFSPFVPQQDPQWNSDFYQQILQLC